MQVIALSVLTINRNLLFFTLTEMGNYFRHNLTNILKRKTLNSSYCVENPLGQHWEWEHEEIDGNVLDQAGSGKGSEKWPELDTF